MHVVLFGPGGARIVVKYFTQKNVELFEAYGISKGKIDDPNKKSINALFKEIHILNEKMLELQNSMQNQKNTFGFQLKQNLKRKRKVKRG